MAGFMKDHMWLFRFYSVLNLVGRSFFKLSALTSVAKRYMRGEKEVIVSGKRKNLDGDEGTGHEIFVGESESLFYLYPDLGNVQHRFNEFQELSLSCGQPMGAILITKREVCRLCKKVPSVDPNSHVVVVYH